MKIKAIGNSKIVMRFVSAKLCPNIDFSKILN